MSTILVKKQLYINKFNFFVKFFTNFIECKTNKANFLSFTCHFSTIFNYFINLY